MVGLIAPSSSLGVTVFGLAVNDLFFIPDGVFSWPSAA